MWPLRILFLIITWAYANVRKPNEIHYCTELFSVTDGKCADIPYNNSVCCLYPSANPSEPDNIHCLPAFTVAGAHKCGTTELKALLKRHEAIRGSPKAEVDFFVAEDYDNLRCKALQYIRWFPANDTNKWISNRPVLTFDKSPSYMREQIYIKRLHSVVPEIKIILTLRFPTSQDFSSFRFQCDPSRGKHVFRKIIDVTDKKYIRYINSTYRIETPAFKFAIYENISKCSSETYHNFITHAATRLKPHSGLGFMNLSDMTPDNAHEYISVHALDHLLYGKYDEQLQYILNYFPANQILILFFEEWILNLKQTLSRIGKFVGFTVLNYSFPNAVINQGRVHIGMYPEDKLLLDKYYTPSLRRLRFQIQKYFNRDLPDTWLERMI